MLTDKQDSFGHGMLDFLNGAASSEIVERDDGLIRANGGPGIYFQPFKDWHPLEKKAIRYASGRVLDIGCGAGRHSLYLQDKGLEVVSVDNSPLAIEVCKRRGLRDARVFAITDVSPDLGLFDTVLLLGGNFGLLGNPRRGNRVFKKLYKLTSKGGRIITTSSDPTPTNDPDHLAYHAANRAKGKLPGELRIRVRYKRYATPWIQFLWASKQETERILDGTGWAVKKYIDASPSQFAAIIEKTQHQRRVKSSGG